MDPKQSRGKERRCKGLPEGKKNQEEPEQKNESEFRETVGQRAERGAGGKERRKAEVCRGWFDVPVPSILEYGSLVLTKTPQQAVRPRKPPSNQISC